MRTTELIPIFTKFVPQDADLLEGVLYVSKEFGCSVHLCPCGCGSKIVVPFKQDGTENEHFWKYVENDKKVSLTPSIGNWQLECKSHYYITENKIVWS